MLAANYDITLDRAADYSFVLTIKDAAGSAVDLTSATFYADIQSSASKSQAISFTATISTPKTLGIVTFALSKADTKILKAGSNLYNWDIFMVLGGLTRRLVYGSVTVRPQYTDNV